MHLHYLFSKPDGFKYPFPDSIWSIFISEAVEYKPEMIIHDDWVDDSELRDIIEVQQLPLERGELLLFDEALKFREIRS